MKTNFLSTAILIASEAFHQKLDKGGHPYILHCLRVMDKVKELGPVVMSAAVLHDVVEDCGEDGYDYEYLISKNIPPRCIEILKLLTHIKGTDYMDYIKKLEHDVHAKAIKIADIEDNSNITRLKGLGKKDIDRMHKYMIAYTYLKNS